MSTRRSLVTRAAAATVATLAVAALGACGADAEPADAAGSSSPAGKVEPTQLVRASVTSLQATQVTVTFVVSGDPNCRQYEDTEVRDEAATVTVLVSVRTTARDCPDDGVETERTLSLSQPLGDRRLVDGATGEPIEVAVVP